MKQYGASKTACSERGLNAFSFAMEVAKLDKLGPAGDNGQTNGGSYLIVHDNIYCAIYHRFDAR